MTDHQGLEGYKAGELDVPVLVRVSVNPPNVDPAQAQIPGVGSIDLFSDRRGKEWHWEVFFCYIIVQCYCRWQLMVHEHTGFILRPEKAFSFLSPYLDFFF